MTNTNDLQTQNPLNTLTMTNTHTLTEKELILLEYITYSDFYENGRESCIWDFSLLDILPGTLKGKTRSGVIGSLANKGFLQVTEKSKKFIVDENGNRKRNPYWSATDFGTFAITEDGYAALDNLKLIDEDGNWLKK